MTGGHTTYPADSLVFLQDGLYKFFQKNVNGFRDMLRIPNMERYNFVLFGGKKKIGITFKYHVYFTFYS